MSLCDLCISALVLCECAASCAGANACADLFVLASRNEEDTNEGGAKQGEKAFGPTSKEGGAEGHRQEGPQGEALKEEKITTLGRGTLIPKQLLTAL